jgi:uncharacterized protein (TIGR02001 family)
MGSVMKIPKRFTARLLAAALGGLSIGPVFAQATPPAVEPSKASEPDYTLTANIGIFSQYVFRGVSQTDEKPAVQGGFDWTHKSGFYLGTWGSNISWLSDGQSAVSAPIELDFYGGYRGSLPADFGYDIGGLYYYYPGNYPGDGYTNPDTFEVYGALSWKFLSAKYSYSTGHTFGFPSSSGSDYLEGNLSYDITDKANDTIGKVTVIAHVGHQRFKGFSAFNYTDWKVGGAADALGLTFGVYVTDTNANKMLYTNAFGKKIADSQVVGYVQKTF